MNSPVAYISSFARPGGNLSWVRTAIILVITILIILTLVFAIKWLRQLFGLDDESKGGEVHVDADEIINGMRTKGFQVDNDFNVGFWVNEFKRVIETFAKGPIYSDRCNVLDKANDLTDAELAAISVAYKLGVGKKLRESIMGLWTNGCWFDHPEKQLLERLERLDQQAMVS